MSSKQIKTFIPETPVEFNSSLLSQLDGAIESNYTREQYAEAYIQQRVQKELKKIESEKLSNLDAMLNNSLRKSESVKNQILSVESINDKLSQVSLGLDDIRINRPKKLEKVAVAETALANCLTDNTGKPLNCWKEVQTFNKLFDHV
ncbi:BA75_04389T0 [Komagataella pastoris]|uniref:BA75_04389T0 n=1 Tax=Komagataella pastoris TaxID=4922 RepID=A0A1B2JI05_PICPA|nr:BA75_04389T0 [Komagataella pastoris]